MTSKSVLIVEDDEDIRDLMKMAIEMEGFTVFTANNGQEALDVLKQNESPCLILLDLMMPVMDGWAFAEELEKSKKLNTIPFIVVTAFAENAANIKKARDIIKKPIQISLLLDMLNKFCV